MNTPEPTDGTPTFSPPAGAVSNPTTVTFGGGVAGSIYCSTQDGSTPISNQIGTACANGTLGGTTVITTAVTVKVISAIFGELDSPVASAAYTISGGITYSRVQGGSQRTNGAANTNAITCAASGGNNGCTTQDVTSGDVVFAFGLSVQTQTIASTGAFSGTWTQLCPNGTSACTGNSVTDTNGCVHDISGGGIGYACGWFAVATSSGTMTVTTTTAASNVSNLVVLEMHKSSGTPTFDVSATSNGNSGFNANCSSGAAGAVAGSGELMIGQGVDNGNYTYTPTGAFTTNDAVTKLNDQQVMENLSGSSGAPTFSATLSGSGNWICMGGAFK